MTYESYEPNDSDESTETDFFLPDLCKPQSILFLVLVSELLVLVQVLFSSNFFKFDWIELSLTSLFIQWLVLVSAALLCNIRPWLMNMSVPRATVIAYGLILVNTILCSGVAEFVVVVLEGRDGLTQEGLGRILRNLLIAAVMTGIAFRYFFLSHQLRIQEQAELTSRIQALQSRIRPHFLFNSMNIIASLISIDPDLAEEVVEDLSVLFRASLNEATSQPVKLAAELDLCEKYVHIESLRLDDRLEVEWRIEADIERIKIPLLTIQPLLENAIYHGIQPLPKGGKVTVAIVDDEKFIEIVITNPVGSDQGSHEGGNRMALDNIRNRLMAVYGPSAKLTATQTNNQFVTRLVYPSI
ncbi:MAG: two-component system sensor histidine kinase AlgZ [Candidatus Azotimanducaceae bacterium]